jgi:hypothetical protein
MDTTQLHPAHPAHHHAGRRTSQRSFPIVLVVSLLALSACAAFAVVMTNGPDGRADAEVAGTSRTTVNVADDVPAVSVPIGEPALSQSLTFDADLASGPLVLGQPGSLVITVTNTHDEPVLLTSVDVSVLPPAVEGCRADWLDIGGYSERTDAPVRIDAGDSAQITLAYRLVNLPDVNQDACKGASFPLSIVGTGRAV